MLIHGDCLEEMKKLPDKSIDLVLTDPPYGITACKWDSVIPFEPMWRELKRIRKGPIALFGSEPFSSALRISNVREFKYDWIWCKNQPSNPSVAKIRPMLWHEIISVFGGKNYFPQMRDCNESTKKRWRDGQTNENQKDLTKDGHFKHTKKPVIKYKTTPKSYIIENVVARATGTLHPTQKPVALLEYLIKTYTLEGETVLDFTMGSGSTGVACKNLNRKFIGIEKDEKYFEIAKQRIYTA